MILTVDFFYFVIYTLYKDVRSRDPSFIQIREVIKWEIRKEKYSRCLLQ